MQHLHNLHNVSGETVPSAAAAVWRANHWRWLKPEKLSLDVGYSGAQNAGFQAAVTFAVQSGSPKHVLPNARQPSAVSHRSRHGSEKWGGMIWVTEKYRPAKYPPLYILSCKVKNEPHKSPHKKKRQLAHRRFHFVRGTLQQQTGNVYVTGALLLATHTSSILGQDGYLLARQH